MMRFSMLLVLILGFTAPAFADCVDGDAACTTDSNSAPAADSYNNPPPDAGNASNDLAAQTQTQDDSSSSVDANLAPFQEQIARGDFSECQRRLDMCGGSQIPVCAQAYIDCNRGASGAQN